MTRHAALTSARELRWLVPLVAVALLAGGALVAVDRTGSNERTVVAVFPRTTGLHEGAKVRVLGVDVGAVEHVEVKGTAVAVTMTYDDKVDLPENVHAMIVAPAIVGDRFVQLAPAYTSGEVLADDARIGLDRTEVPIELDDTYQAVSDLAAALGPQGANKDGALARLIDSTATAVKGRGRELNRTVRSFADALATIGGAQDDLDGTVVNLDSISKTLGGNDQQLRSLVSGLAEVSGYLNDQRTGISAAVKGLDSAMKELGDFVKTNRDQMTKLVKNAGTVSEVLAGRTDELAELADIAPVGLTSLLNIYVPRNWSPQTRAGTVPGGRIGSQVLRAALFNDLDIQLAATLTSVCSTLPEAQRKQLSNVCDMLASTGSSLGGLLMQSTNGLLTGLSAMPGAQSLTSLLRVTR